MGRFSTFGPGNVIRPRFNPVGPDEPIRTDEPMVAAYLEGRPVLLGQPGYQRAGYPADLTVPFTVSRIRRARDIETGRDAAPYEQSMVEDFPLSQAPFILAGIGGLGFGGPGLSETIQCCPWRLDTPRWLTQYEWTIVQNTIEESVVTAQGGLYSAQSKAMAVALTTAIASQNQAPAWKQSAFGPAPAVATYAYGCLGSWWATLDPLSQGRVITDIHATDLLRRDAPPWATCPRALRDQKWTAGMQSEYQIQKGITGHPGIVDACADTRYRTAYFPTTGQGLIAMMEAVGGGVLSPDLQQLVRMGGTVFSNRTFIVGLEFKRVIDWNKMPATLASMQDLMKVLDAMVAEIALIWAPGQGSSLRQMVTTGQIDPAQLAAMAQALMPTAIDDFFKAIPALLPMLPGLLGGAAPMNVTAPLNVSKSFSDPSTPPNTGYRVVDKPGSQQSDAAPTGATAASVGPDVGVWLAVAAVVVGGALLIRGYQTA